MTIIPSLSSVAGGEEGDYTPLATLTLIIFPSATDIIIPGPRVRQVGVGKRKGFVSSISPPPQKEPLHSSRKFLTEKSNNRLPLSTEL